MKRMRRTKATDEEARDRRRRQYALVALAGVATVFSSTMLFWVSFLPGSCSFAARRLQEGDTSSSSFLTSAGRIVPKTLITKYATEGHRGRLACVTHVLPSAAWSALAPFQLLAFFFSAGNKKNASRRRALHRVAGRALFAVSVCMTFGYVFAIHRTGMHFHRHDFPSLESGDFLSAAPPLAKLWRVAGGASAFEFFEHLCAFWFCATAFRAVFVAARGNRTREGGSNKRGWVRVHRAWAIRHLAAGYSVAAQRAFVALFHFSCRVLFFRDAERACASPAAQKGIFADALVLGTALCVAAGEAAIRDADALDDAGGKRE